MPSRYYRYDANPKPKRIRQGVPAVCGGGGNFIEEDSPEMGEVSGIGSCGQAVGIELVGGDCDGAGVGMGQALRISDEQGQVGQAIQATWESVGRTVQGRERLGVISDAEHDEGSTHPQSHPRFLNTT